MNSRPAVAPSGDSGQVEPPFPPALVEELLLVFGKAVRAQQLYLPNNPVYRGAIDNLRRAFSPIWAEEEELVLEIRETELRWSGVPVMEEPTKGSDSLPWLFFKDGLRELRIMQGFEAEEVVTLLDILQRARKASPEEDDLLTLLWEADFIHLRYRYVDLSIEPAAPLADGRQVTERPPHELREEVQQAAESLPTGLVNVADFDTTLYFLEEREVDYIRDEIRREYEQDLRRNVVAILLDIFEQQAAPEVRAEVAEILENLMLHLLSAGRLSTVAFVLRESQAAVQRSSAVTAEQRERLAQLPSRLSAPEALSQLVQSLDESVDLPPSAEIVELFEQLRAEALATVFSWLPRLQNARLRPYLEQAASRLSSANTAELVRLIVATDHAVAVEAVRRAGALKTPAAVPSLVKVLQEGDAELRQLAVQALSEIGSPSAMQGLEKAVDDVERDVRLAAARAFTSRNYRAALPRIEAAVKGRALREADLTERMAYFEAFGTLCGDGGVAFLDSTLNGKSFFGRREDAEVRACAAYALGRVGTEKARDALRRASEDKEVLVRTAVNRALRGGGS